MKRKSKFSVPGKYVLLIATILCIGMIVLTFSTDIAVGPLKTVSGYVFVPIQNGINSVGSWISHKADNLQSLKDVMSENKELKEQVSDLTVQNNLLQQDKYELDRLRVLFELSEKYPEYQKVAARVTGKDPGNWFQIFLIDKGSNDGLAVDMNVLAEGGLVGIITEVGPNWSKVRSIIDDASNVSGMALSTSNSCIVTGDLTKMNEGVIDFSQMSDKANAVAKGEQIVTSYVSSKFLQGLLIGYVNEISTDSNNLTKSGTITPAVDFEHLETVLVIKDLKQQ